MNGVNLRAAVYTTATGSSIDTVANSATALNNIKAAINQLSADRGQVGATMSRLFMTADRLSILPEKMSAANRQIEDVDAAQESAHYAKANILVQAGTAMLAQASTNPQPVMKVCLK
jgi:flagellin